MNSRWLVLGIIAFAVWVIVTFAIVYTAIELTEDDTQVVTVEAPELTIDPRCIAAIEAVGTAATGNEHGFVQEQILGYVDEYCD